MSDTQTTSAHAAPDPQPAARTFTLEEIAQGFGTLVNAPPPLVDSGFTAIFADRSAAATFAAWAGNTGYTVVTPDVWTVRLPDPPMGQ